MHFQYSAFSIICFFERADVTLFIHETEDSFNDRRGWLDQYFTLSYFFRVQDFFQRSRQWIVKHFLLPHDYILSFIFVFLEPRVSEVRNSASAVFLKSYFRTHLSEALPADM